jgi:RimJ/RimL family protein N-acetyltransferase
MSIPVFVRPLCQEDIGAYLALFSPMVQSALSVSSVAEEREYLIVHLAQQMHGMTFFYGIFLSDTQQLIGAIEIRDKNAYRGQLYCWVHEKYWGTGYFIQAMQRAAADYFGQTNARFFNALVSTSNKRSYKALKKCGFADSGFYSGLDGDSFELVLRRQ